MADGRTRGRYSAQSHDDWLLRKYSRCLIPSLSVVGRVCRYSQPAYDSHVLSAMSACILLSCVLKVDESRDRSRGRPWIATADLSFRQSCFSSRRARTIARFACSAVTFTCMWPSTNAIVSSCSSGENELSACSDSKSMHAACVFRLKNWHVSISSVCSPGSPRTSVSSRAWHASVYPSPAPASTPASRMVFRIVTRLPCRAAISPSCFFRSPQEHTDISASQHPRSPTTFWFGGVFSTSSQCTYSSSPNSASHRSRRFTYRRLSTHSLATSRFRSSVDVL